MILKLTNTVNMAYKRKGQLTHIDEWAKHFRKDLKRIFWHKERMAEKKFIKEKLNEQDHSITL